MYEFGEHNGSYMKSNIVIRLYEGP